MTLKVTREAANIISQELEVVFSSPNSAFYVMKGIQPSQVDVNNIVNGTSVQAWRGSDILVEYPIDIDYNADPTSLEQYIVILSESVAATGAGLASWWVLTQDNTDIGNTANALIIGNITALGGGGDFEITNTSVTVGQLVQAFSLKFNVPLETI